MRLSQNRRVEFLISSTGSAGAPAPALFSFLRAWSCPETPNSLRLQAGEALSTLKTKRELALPQSKVLAMRMGVLIFRERFTVKGCV